MDIWEANKLIIFIAFVIPGFITLKTYELLVPTGAKETGKQLIDAIAYSCINYAILFWPITLVENAHLKDNCPVIYWLFFVLVLLVAPIAWAFLYKRLRTTSWAQKAIPHPTEKPWDYVFGQSKPYWVIVTLKDGTRLGGLYDTESFASSAPAPEQIYLQQTWILNDDGAFERAKENTAGIIILSSDIMAIEFFNA